MMLHVIIRQFFVGILLGITSLSFAQRVVPLAQSNLNNLEKERTIINYAQMERARVYSQTHNQPMKFDDGRGNTLYMIGLDEFGLPVYRTTLNAGAAITTRVPQLRSGGSLGLNLLGEGMVVGIWDESKVKDHVEFGSRITSRQGDSFSKHASHVTGTILATGIDANAKGMAPLAKATTWDFINDEAEMAALAKPDQSSLLISNHSYGIVLGFYTEDNAWKWAGNTAISTKEDYRFGFYSNTSRTLDQIGFNAPYYTMVWAGGNDRSEVGDGTHPADGNEGTGYDCMGPDGGAKNVLTIGAVNKVVNYTGPSSVVMSSFSSWGPTDDGRIKPDLVGTGVSVYSTFINGTGQDAYSVQQGTSMAAPNVTGSLTLVQQLYRDLHAGKFMRAATLKALAIHTAKEAGLSPGPDYSFGWGLLDVEAAAKILLTENNNGVVLQENTLANGGSYIYNFEPMANTKITATIVWTDPAGTPVAAALDPTNKMLVNDLDIRLIDDANNTISPWILNPLNPSLAATKGNNSSDNVEKIEFSLPEPRMYRVVVSHKGTLLNAKQDFSLILTYTPDSAPKTVFYWIGNSGNWNDPTKWSLTSGGTSANQVPDVNSRVIMDENSFTIKNPVVSLTTDASCASVTWLTKKNVFMALNNHKLSVDGNIIVTSDSLETTNGVLELVGASSLQNQFNLHGNNFSTVDVVVNSSKDATWTFNGDAKIKSLTLQRGNVIAKDLTLTVKQLDASGTSNKVLDITNSTLEGLTSSTLSAANLDFKTNATSSVKLGTVSAVLSWPGITFNGTLETKTSPASLSGGATINKIIVNGELTLSNTNSFHEFITKAGSALKIQTGSTQTFTSKTSFLTDAANRLSISAMGGGSSTLNFSGHFKGCFDFLDVNNIGVSGDVTISAGINSTLTTAPKWFSGACADALFANFDSNFACKDALTEFTDSSEGNVTSWSWDFGDPASSENASLKQDAAHLFNTPKAYTVKLTVTDGVASTSTSKTILITNNSIAANKVIVANDKLFSESTALAYQWYKNGEKLDGEVNRSYEYMGEPGNYFVVIKNATCNIPSSLYLVTGVEEDFAARVGIFPNPASEFVTVQVPETNLPVRVSVVDALGQIVFSRQINDVDVTIDTGALMDGFYIIDISGKQVARKKLIVRH